MGSRAVLTSGWPWEPGLSLVHWGHFPLPWRWRTNVWFTFASQELVQACKKLSTNVERKNQQCKEQEKDERKTPGKMKTGKVRIKNTFSWSHSMLPRGPLWCPSYRCENWGPRSELGPVLSELPPVTRLLESVTQTHNCLIFAVVYGHFYEPLLSWVSLLSFWRNSVFQCCF